MNELNQFEKKENQGLSVKLTKKQKIAVISIIIVVIGLLLLIFLKKGASSSARKNTLSLVKMYMDKGEYDRALDKLEELLIKNADDKDANELMNLILLKKENALGANNSNVTVEVNTQGLTEAMQSSLEDNRRAMEELIKAQKEQNEKERALLKEREEKTKKEQFALKKAEEESKKALEAQKKAEEDRKKAEEEKKKALEEARLKKNAELKKEMDDVNEEIQKAQVALNSGNISNAFNYFSSAESKLPVSDGEPGFSASKYSQMAKLLYDSAENASNPEEKAMLEQKAFEYAEKAVQKNPGDAVSNYILGMNAMGKKDYKKALDYLTKACDGDNKNYEYYYNLGRAQYMLKKFTEAKYSFGTSCSLNSNFAPARYNLGLTDLKLSDKKSALSDFRKAHDIDPRYEKAYLEEARLLVTLQDFDGAISSYQKVIQINSVNRAAFQELGSAYYQRGLLEKAEESFRKSLALLQEGKQDPLTFYNLSTVLYDLKKNNDALTYAKKAYEAISLLKDNNQKINIIYNYALICDKTGKFDEALSRYAEVLNLKPSHTKALVNLGVMYMSMDPPDSEMALSLFTKAYEMDKNNFEANNNLGSAYLSKKDYKNAIIYFQNALMLDQKNNEVRFNLGKAFASDGQFDNAKTTYLELLRLNGEYWDGYIELAKVCMALDDDASCEMYLITVQEKKPGYRSAEIQSLLNSIE